MWAKMVEVADSFYEFGAISGEVFRVLFAWAIILLPILFIFGLGYIIIFIILEWIREKLRIKFLNS